MESDFIEALAVFPESGAEATVESAGDIEDELACAETCNDVLGADPGSVEVRQKLQIASWMSLWPLRQEGDKFA